MPQTTYPLDITGVHSANRVSNESFTIQSPVGPMPAFIVPTFAPFNGNPTYVTVKHGPANAQTTLTHGVDYVFKHYFSHAKEQLNKDFYGSIVFINRNLSGPITVTYNTIGGVYCLDSVQAIIDRTNSLLALQTVYWDQIVGVPEMLPPTGHTHPPEELLGWNDLITKMDEAIAAISDNDNVVPLLQALQNMVMDHIQDTSNPHDTDKVKTQLGNVPNFSVANASQSEDRNNNSVFATPRTAWLMINAVFDELVSPYIANLPVDADSIGLGSVVNAGVASQAEAEAGGVDKYILASRSGSLVRGRLKAVDINNSTRTGTTTFPHVRLQSDHPDYPVGGNNSDPVIVHRIEQPNGYWLELAYPDAGIGKVFMRRVTSNNFPVWRSFGGYGFAIGTNAWGMSEDTMVSPSVSAAFVSGGLNRGNAITSHASIADQIVAQFVYSGELQNVQGGATTPDTFWRVENVYYDDVSFVPGSGKRRCQIATTMPPEDVLSDDTYVPSVYIRYVDTNGASLWKTITADVGNVPNWEAATSGDMTHDTTVNNKFVAPVNVRQYANNRFGSFLQRVTVSTTSAADAGARVGDVHFQIT